MELVVLLYLLDNDTSFLVLFTVGGTLAVNLWKVFSCHFFKKIVHFYSHFYFKFTFFYAIFIFIFIFNLFYIGGAGLDTDAGPRGERGQGVRTDERR
jgi:hypothetical protein